MMINPLTISNKRRYFEIIAVVLTALGKFLFMDALKWRFPFIATAIILWSFYVIYQSKTKPGITKYWGFRTDNFTKVVKTILPFGIFSLAVFLGLGFWQHSINISWHIIPILILYPVWGIIQQFLLIALTVGNLQDYQNIPFSTGLTLIFPAALFGLIHYPSGWLIAATFVLAIFYGLIYVKERNIYALGIFHGWLGGFFYYTVLNRDPFMEVFGRLIHKTA